MKKLLNLALILVLAAGTVNAQNATVQNKNSAELSKPGFVPGDFFYPVEQFVEEIEVGISKSPVIGSPELEAKVRANNAEERLSEARKLANQNRSKASERLMQQYRSNMEIAVKNAQRTNNTLLTRQLGNVTAKHENVLKDVQTKVPAPAKTAIQNALDNNRDNFPAVKPSTPRNRPEGLRSGKPSKPKFNKTNLTESFKDKIAENTQEINGTFEDDKETLNSSENIEETINKTEESAENLTKEFSGRGLKSDKIETQSSDSLP